MSAISAEASSTSVPSSAPAGSEGAVKTVAFGAGPGCTVTTLAVNWFSLLLTSCRALPGDEARSSLLGMPAQQLEAGKSIQVAGEDSLTCVLALIGWTVSLSPATTWPQIRHKCCWSPTQSGMQTACTFPRRWLRRQVLLLIAPPAGPPPGSAYAGPGWALPAQPLSAAGAAARPDNRLLGLRQALQGI